MCARRPCGARGYRVSAACARRTGLRVRERRRGSSSRSIGVSQYGHTCHSASSGRWHATHACRSFVVQTGQTRKSVVDLGTADRALQVAAAEPLLHRPDLELALAHVLEVLGRAEEHVDQRADERRSTPSSVATQTSSVSSIRRRRVLEDPVDGREPEDDHEEDPRGCGSRTTSTSGRSRERRRTLDRDHRSIRPSAVPGREREPDEERPAGTVRTGRR